MAIEVGVKTVAIPPGEAIKDLLENRAMSYEDFVILMKIPEKSISELIDGKTVLMPDMANRTEINFLNNQSICVIGYNQEDIET